MKTSTPKGFTLRKAKLLPNNKCTTNWSSDTESAPDYGVNHYVHPDLIEALQKMKYALIASHGLNWPQVNFHADLFTDPSESGAFKALKKHLKKCEAEINESISVTGFSSFGDEGTRGCVVTGKLTIKGRTLGISSCKFQFGGDAFGFEEQLDTDIDNAINEVRLYLFEGKCGEAPEKDPSQTKMNLDGGEDGEETQSLKPRGQRKPKKDEE